MRISFDGSSQKVLELSEARAILLNHVVSYKDGGL